MSMVGGSGPEEWFGGHEGRNDEEIEFLAQMRTGASAAPWSLSPERTCAMNVGVPFYLSIELPAVAGLGGPRIARSLEVEYWSAGSRRGSGVEGAWGDSRYPFDSIWNVEGGSLVVLGADLTPAEAATLAMRWLKRQMGRQIRIRRWASSAATVELADSGDSLGSVGHSWQRRGAPVQEVTIRVDQEEPPTR